MGRRSQKAIMVPVTRTTRNRSRHYKSKLITDTAQSTMQLTNQLRALGLYAAPTLGDGNCLFRALSDQLWGHPNGHLKLRAEICDWMESQRDRYEGFVDEDRTFDTHLKLMRIPGTYGGHLELSAFAHLKHRNVKVIQPGLIYIIEWNCGWTSDTGNGGGDESTSAEVDADQRNLSEREKRRLRREKKKVSNKKKHEKVAVMEEEGGSDESEQQGAIYVAYHDWEHFSSVRNITGPHTGLPNVVEKPPPRGQDDLPTSLTVPNTQSKGKVAAKAVSPQTSKKISVPTTAPTSPIPSEPLVLSATPSASLSRSSSVSELDDSHLLTPAHIPLPPSRSVSPPISDSIALSPPASQISNISSQSTHVSAPLSHMSTSLIEGRLTPTTITIGSILAATLSGHSSRSPKRTFDETEEKEAAEATASLQTDERRTSSKRHKLRSSSKSEASRRQIDLPRSVGMESLTDVEYDNINSTPSLSSDDSSHEDNSLSSNSSTLHSPPTRTLRSSTVSKGNGVSKPARVVQQYTPTRRQKRRAAVTAMQNMDKSCASKNAKRTAARVADITPSSTRTLRSASKTITSATPSGTSSANEEWQKNGYGRVDVRGFRELRI